MIALIETALMSQVLAFCRVGACFLLLPGISGPRIPAQLRLFIALGVALAVSRLVDPALAAAAARATGAEFVVLMVSEMLIGLVLGLMIRLFFVALQFAATMMTNVIGLVMVPQPAIADDEASAPTTELIVVGALAVMFALDLHLQFLAVLLDSYATLAPGVPIAAGLALERIVAAASSAFALALEIGAPFILYSIVVNALLAIANRWVPQIPVQFIAAPVVAAGGLLVLAVTAPGLIDKFLMRLRDWLGTI